MAKTLRAARLRALPLALALPALLGATRPAVEGTEVELGTGTVRAEVDDFRANPTYRYRTAGMNGHLQLRHRTESGLSFTGQLGVEGALIVGNTQLAPTQLDDWSAPRYNLGEGTVYGGVAGRVGQHWRFLGVEAGGAAFRDNLRELAIRPSAEGWIGAPKLAYLWGAWNTGPLHASNLFNEPTVGVGHRGEWVTAHVGAHVASRLLVPPDKQAPWVAGATIEVNPGVRIGVDYAEGRRSRQQAQADTRLMFVVQVDQKERAEAPW